MPDYLKKNFFINLFTIIAIFSLDRISKLYIILKTETNLYSNLFSSKFLNINLIWNEGIAFGLLSYNENFIYNSITVIIFIVIMILLVMLINAERLNRIALLMITGGAFGNLFDRIYYSAVLDFIDISFKNFHWFIFNVADIFISIGIICLIFAELLIYKRNHEN